MGKKRKGEIINTDSIDTNKVKKSKKSKVVIAEDVDDDLNQNSETVEQCSINKKRKKNKYIIPVDVAENIKEDSETVVQSVGKKKRKDKKNKDEIAEDVVENLSSKISLQDDGHKKRKGKEIKDKYNVKNLNEFNESAVQSTNNFKVISNSKTPKKIVFVDDEPQEVSVTANAKTTKSKPVKRTQEHNNDILREEDVKDEDIDKFCDELGEEDNQQYENWVQLIEASLSSNKKKPK